MWNTVVEHSGGIQLWNTRRKNKQVLALNENTFNIQLFKLVKALHPTKPKLKETHEEIKKKKIPAEAKHKKTEMQQNS